MGRLLGVAVPRSGKVPCPFHEDRTPSLHVYATGEDGWCCFSARCAAGGRPRGGTIYDLAGPLLGYQTTGQDFRALKRELLRIFSQVAV